MARRQIIQPPLDFTSTLATSFIDLKGDQINLPDGSALMKPEIQNQLRFIRFHLITTLREIVDSNDAVMNRVNGKQV